jgi:DNA polymerase V
MYSRTFAHMTNSQTILTKELSNYAMAAARRLREQGSICGAVTVFLATNRHRSDLAQYNIDDTIKLTTATDDTRLIIEAVHLLLKRIYKPHFQYKQAGVILSQLQSNSSVQLDLFASYSTDESARQKRLMRAIDTINERFGRNQIHFAVQGVENDTQDEPAGFMRPHNIE